MVGPPGSGKSSLAKAMAGILPPMTTEEAIVTSKIYSVAGMKGSQIGLIRTRPFVPRTTAPRCPRSSVVALAPTSVPVR